MLNKVELQDVPGSLFLSPMPGRYQPIDQDFQEMREKDIDKIVTLTSMDEIRRVSPEYALAIEADQLPVERREFPISDFGVPPRRQAYMKLVNEIASDLKEGRRVMIHCAAGVGRSGTLAISVMIALGFSKGEAHLEVSKAHGRPETPEQRELIDWVDEYL